MKIAATALVSLALASSTMAADDSIESVVSGTVTIQIVPSNPSGVEALPGTPATGQVVVRFGTKKAAAQPHRLHQCGERWNKQLAEHNKRLEQAKGTLSLRGQVDQPLTRFHYRKHMYDCLEGAEQNPTTAQQTPRPDGS